MRVVVALGGNALLRRGQPLTAENQRANVRVAARSLGALIRDGHRVIISHGNGPQVGLLALQGAAFRPDESYPLDVLGAETEGMIGYLIEQELDNELGEEYVTTTLLTQIEVDPEDPAFAHPTKPIGPAYSREEAEELAERRGWSIAPDGDQYRRVVPSPAPKRVLDISVIRLLVDQGITVICAGGGGIPVVQRPDGAWIGVEAVIDKDYASALLARELGAGGLVMLTDVAAVELDWNTPQARRILRASPAAMREQDFAAGSMGPKVGAACDFAEATGGIAAIGRLEDAAAILAGEAGTTVDAKFDGMAFHG